MSWDDEKVRPSGVVPTSIERLVSLAGVSPHACECNLLSVG
ncbi:hypothetical protein [Kistimonas scapharcae]